ncbi:MAG: hypothetical protein DYG88_03765 [Chloroflexi bacterium CFX4]|nr:hypothetical protein [Chloroflexi bacterium CFX4]MDL1921113.1 hypothetical protein [Chloroflexi bacterium CFX3]
MRNVLSLTFYLLFVLGILLAGCASSAAQPTVEPLNTPQTDLVALARFVRLDSPPRSAQWFTAQMTPPSESPLGPTDWQLIALLEYDAATLQQLRATLTPHTTPRELHIRPDFIQDWFPEVLRANFQIESASGNLIWQGERYLPSTFAKPPLTAGFVLVIDRYVLLVLHTV